jgi:DNA-directed RNA polymerase specialized sigma24 family protein
VPGRGVNRPGCEIVVGDVRARRNEDFEAFFHAGFDRCVGVARRITCDEAAAEELAAEAFARAWAR